MTMTKSLYLLPRQAVTVTADGPALAVHRPETAPRRYPLARVSTICAGPEVTWSGEALACCLQAGIPVAFLTRTGETAGVAVGQASRCGTLAERLARLRERNGGEARYEDWWRAREREEALRAAREANLRLTDLRPKPARAALERHWEAAWPGWPWGAMRSALRAAAHAMAAHELSRAGADPVQRVNGRIPLVMDVADLLRWGLDGVAGRAISRHQGEGQGPGLADVARLALAGFEAERPTLERHARRLLHRLAVWLEETR